MRPRLPALLATLVALLVLPATGWAEAEHGHCDEPSTAPAVSLDAPVPAGAVLEAAPAPCGDCPGTSCPEQDHCSAGQAPCVAPSLAPGTVLPAGLQAIARRSVVPTLSFDTTPPTPPPDLAAR